MPAYISQRLKFVACSNLELIAVFLTPPKETRDWFKKIDPVAPTDTPIEPIPRIFKLLPAFIIFSG
jgi:hypothetical protein